MDFLDLAKKRYSVRSFLPQPVEADKLKHILEAGRVAPTGANKQPQRLIVVQQNTGLEKLKNAARTYDAPLVIIVCGDTAAAWTRPFDGKNVLDIDASIVTDHMMMAATELGLGTIWICYFKPDVIRQEFNLPANIEPVNILGIGYAAGEPLSPNRHDTQRKPLYETVFFETMS